MSNKAKLLAILEQYRTVEVTAPNMSDFYHALSDAIDKLPDDIGAKDADQLATSIHETINNVNNLFENGIIVTTTYGDVTETVAYVGELGIKQYNAEKSACEMDESMQRKFDDLALVGGLHQGSDKSYGDEPV